MKIGLVGTAHSIQSIRALVAPQNIFAELVSYPCNVEGVGKLVEQIQPELDGIFFTGYFFFSYACRSTAAVIPWTYAKRTDNATIKALLQAAMNAVDISRITYDLTENSVEQIAGLLRTDVGLQLDNLHVYRYVDSNYYTISEKDYVRNAMAYHLENLSSGRATVCLSGMYEIVEQLKARGFSAFWVEPTADVLNLALNELSLRHQIRKSRKAGEQYQIAVVALSISFSDCGIHSAQEYLLMHSVHQLETCIYNFAQSICAAVEEASDRSFRIYTTKEELGAVTGQFTQLGLLQEIQLIDNVTSVTAGIGFGLSPGSAKAHAEYGARLAQKRECSCYYIVGEDDILAGPFWAASSGREEKVREVWKQKISQETGIGSVTLEALAAAQARFGFDTVTPGKLAELCAMTPSNMNRVLAKLEAKDYAETVGYQPLAGAGRPRRLIRLKINI